MVDSYEQSVQQSRKIAIKMRTGSGAANLLTPQQAPTHYIDTLQRFQKDFASYDKAKRQEEKIKKQQQLQKRRIEQLQRQNRRWQQIQNYDRKIKSRQQDNLIRQNLGIRKISNSNSLAYNPINLEYQKNPEGQKLRLRDQDSRIRGYVRAQNMDLKGNCQYNLINGEKRLVVDKVVPQDLKDRFSHKLNQHFERQSIKAPSSSNSIKPYNIIG